MTISTISRRYHFEAAHFLPHVPEGHRCKRLHGHNYEFEVTIKGPLDDKGWVLDFWELDHLITPFLMQLDHRLLNDIRGLENPTAELIAWWLLERIEDALLFRADEENDTRPLQVQHVCVYETKDCCAVAFAHDRRARSEELHETESADDVLEKLRTGEPI